MVIVLAESPSGQFKKASFEALTYGKKLAAQLGVECIALTLGTEATQPEQLGRYGADKVLRIADSALNQVDSQLYAQVIADACARLGAQVLILSHTSTGKQIAGRLSARMKAGLVTGVNALPEINDGAFLVKKSVFSGKAIATYRVATPVKILSLMGNAIRPEANGSDAQVEDFGLTVPAPRIQVLETRTQEGRVPLPEAEIVVSAGRGMKDPSNWGIVEELAEALNATTACSRPVADSHWRPHHEHVGQTGTAIRPNLYIAIGISGAIQHLAGVNNSKVIVVINKDPEAPFFKAADYGVEGDLFEVVPRLTEAIRRYKVSAN